MKNKKIVKQLMAIGVQRNDAAAFTRTYRKIVNAGRLDLFPAMDFPVPHVVQEVPVQMLEVSIMRHRHDMYGLKACGVDVDQYIRKCLARELADCLISSPHVRYWEKDIPTGDVEIKAQLRVVGTHE